MRRTLLVALLGLALAGGGPVSSSRADPAVQGIAIASAPLLLWALFEKEPTTRDPDLLTGVGGWFDGMDRENEAALFGLEYRSNLWLWKFKPFIGAMGTTDKGFYSYAGLRLDAYFFKRIMVSTNMAPTLYVRGNGKDLGSMGVLRSGLEVAYRFDDLSQLGAGFHHMSHGKVFGNLNPGTETIEITYSIPLSKLFGK
jgi:hypothetical protein